MEFSQYPVNSLMQLTTRPQLVFTEGHGMWLTDHSGKKYLDFVQGWAVNCLGHSPPCIEQALSVQAKKLINPSPAFYNEPSLQLAALLTQHSCFDRVFFASSGAEANEGAIKLARKWGSKHKNGAFDIITFHRGFHGRTLATMSASGKPGWDALFAPKVPGFPKADYNDIDSVEQLITSNTVAVMLEPVQGEAGVIPATDAFMQALRALTQKYGLLLIVDEVQSGMGRTGQLFAYQHSGVVPDIMTLGKGIGGGVPLSALLCREEIACFEPGDQGGTYNGNPLMTAVGVAVMQCLLQPGFMDEVKEKGVYLASALNRLSDKYGLQGERGNGLLRALKLGQDKGAQIAEISRNLAPCGLLLNAAQPDLLRFMPALNVTHSEIDQMIGILDGVLATALV
ncbi:MAG: acetylornithine transaminase [Pseudomonadota bacterium]